MFKLLVLAVVAVSVASAFPATLEVERTISSVPTIQESRTVQLDAPIKGQQLVQSTQGLAQQSYVAQGYSSPLLSYSAIPMVRPHYAYRAYAAPLYRAFHAAAPIMSVKGGYAQELQDTRQEIKGQSLDIQATKGQLDLQSTKGGFQSVQAVKGGQEFQAVKGADFQAVKGGDFQAIKGHPMRQLESWSQKV